MHRGESDGPFDSHIMKPGVERMGVRLASYDGVYLSTAGFRACLRVARQFGWTPTGTSAPSNFEGNWDGNYLSSDGQIVNDADARALAAALFRAIRAIRENEPLTASQEAAVEEGSLRAMVDVADLACRGWFGIF